MRAPPPTWKAESSITVRLWTRRGCARGLEDHLRHRGAAWLRRKSSLSSPQEIFDELRVASKGGICDYYGITWDRIDREYGVCWPCPSRTILARRDFTKETSSTILTAKHTFSPWNGSLPSKRRTMNIRSFSLQAGWSSHFLSGTQTRRIGALMDQYPQPLCEIHPLLAAKLGIAEGDFAKVESRRGSVTVRARW